MKIRLLYICCFTLFIFGCDQKAGNFSVTAPLGWMVIDSVSKTKGKMVRMYPRVKITEPQFVENIRITINQAFSVDMYVFGVLSLVKKDAYFFEEKGKGTIKINNYKIKWTHHIIQYDKNEPPIEQKGYFIGDSGNVYMIVCSSKINEMENFQSKINEVLNSFKVI